MLSKRVQNGMVGVSISSSEPLVLLQVTHGEEEANFQQARCSMTVEETKRLIEDLKSALKFNI